MALHFGHRDNPAVIIAPGDLDRAVTRVWQPTEAQARGGNYKMAHAVLGTWDKNTGRVSDGIEITIETPLDRMRHGKGPDGTPWSVRMPAHYGYVKRTTGADNDHVDIYVGPEAHRVASLPVWIVDQCDADTGKFDEHKTMLGFANADSACKTYMAAFSDGKGHKRIGAVARLTFDDFRRWLNSDRTKDPIIMKSAYGVDTIMSYGPATCRCDAATGGSMTTENTAKADATPAEAGLFASLIAKGLATLTPTERTELMASAAVQVGTDIAKAESTLSDDHGTIRVITDTWTSGDEGRAKVVSAHGPGSSANGGVPVGPEQQASGGGAQSMEREYSRFAAQTAGLQTATEALGRDISAGRAAMKSILEAVKGQGLLIEAMRGGAATVTVPDNTAIQSMIDTAIAKAVADINRQTAKSIAVLAKKDNPFGSEDEGDDAEDDDEADDDEKSAAVIKSDIDAERMAEGDAEATSKAIEAATLRVLAKCRVKWASRRLVKADEAAEKDRPKTAAHMIAKARFNLAKAVEYVNTAKELRDGDEGPSTAKILSQIAKSKAALPKAEAAKNNQDKWPDGKGEGDAAKGTVVPQDAVAVKALQDAVEKIAKAADGFGMLQASIGQVMNTLTSRGTGEQGTLPPTFALAKSSADDLTTRESEIMKLADTSVIDFDTLDKARDVIGLARSNVPPELLNARMARLPPVVREILTRAA